MTGEATAGDDPAAGATRVDVVVVGAGFAGLYMLHCLRQAGFDAVAVEAAPSVGGTWYWNRYPGARCDIESMQYSYQFSEELQQEWTWTERYASQPELLAYIEHVAERFQLLPHIRFDTKVAAARFDDDTHRWTVTLEPSGLAESAAPASPMTIEAQHVVLGVGSLSTVEVPSFEAMDTFRGSIYHTARWPAEGVDVSGQRVGIIGTGSSAVQSIPLLARQAHHLHVFQRTANYVVPARNRPLADDEVAAIKADYRGFRDRAKQRPTAFLFPFSTDSALSVDPEERRRRYEVQWEIGGLPFLGAFGDLLTDQRANDTVRDYWRSKIAEVVDDPEVADLLTPRGDIFGCKRLCAGTNYYETYNRPNVTLVDVSETGIERFTPTGVQAAGAEFDLDVVVCATGFDAMTGSVVRIDIAGPDGATLADKWSEGVDNYLGLAVSGFPNLFNLAGPGSPSVLATMVTGIEHQAEWLTECLSWLRDRDLTRIEADAEAERWWVSQVAEAAAASLRSTCDSWYVGSNVAGKPRVFMPYIGGFPRYVDTCAEVAAEGYRGFLVS